MWDEIIDPFPNFNGTTVEVWEWIRNFIPHFTGYVISYQCWDLKVTHVSKRDMDEYSHTRFNVAAIIFVFLIYESSIGFDNLLMPSG